jgi:hypothetical protein
MVVGLAEEDPSFGEPPGAERHERGEEGIVEGSGRGADALLLGIGQECGVANDLEVDPVRETAVVYLRRFPVYKLFIID